MDYIPVYNSAHFALQWKSFLRTICLQILLNSLYKGRLYASWCVCFVATTAVRNGIVFLVRHCVS